MPRLPLRPSREIDLAAAVFFLFTTAVCLITRLYTLRKISIQSTKLIYMEQCSIICAVILNCTILNFALMRYSLISLSSCEISFRLSVILHILNRSFFYAFIVWRIDLVNTMGNISRCMINSIKWSVLVNALFLLSGPLFMTEATDEIRLCPIRIDQIVMILGSIFDFIICLLSSWLFIRPLYNIVKTTKNITMRNTMVKEIYCVATSLLATVLALLAVSFFDGILHIAGGFDSTVTTCCLVAIATPISSKDAKAGSISRSCCPCFGWFGRNQRVTDVQAMLEGISYHFSSLLPIPKTSSKLLAEEIDDILLGLSLSELKVDREITIVGSHLGLPDGKKTQTIPRRREMPNIQKDKEVGNSTLIVSFDVEYPKATHL